MAKHNSNARPFKVFNQINFQTMSKLWNTLKSVVGGHAVEDVAAAAKTAASVSSAPVGAPAVTSDGMLQGFAAIKPHQPLIKFR